MEYLILLHVTCLKVNKTIYEIFLFSLPSFFYHQISFFVFIFYNLALERSMFITQRVRIGKARG